MSANTLAGVPRHPNDITPVWLTERLVESGALSSGAVASLTVELGAKWNQAATARLTIDYDAEAPAVAPQSLFVKIAQSEDPLEDVLPGEFAFYADTTASGLPLAACHGAFRDRESRHTCLLLEDLTTTHEETPWPLPPSLPRCEGAVAALARLHAHWWHEGSSETSDLGGKLWAKEERIAGVVQGLLPAFLDDLGDRLPVDRRDLLLRTLARTPELVRQRLARGRPITRIHGDAHLWNVLYPKDPSRHGCVFIDWEDWRYDLGASDLALMIALHWYPDRRARHESDLLRTYLEALRSSGIEGYGWDNLLVDYRLGHLQNAVVPVFQHAMAQPHASWWSHLERWFLAFEDLDCAALL